jgi:hypothetical protein
MPASRIAPKHDHPGGGNEGAYLTSRHSVAQFFAQQQ